MRALVHLLHTALQIILLLHRLLEQRQHNRQMDNRQPMMLQQCNQVSMCSHPTADVCLEQFTFPMAASTASDQNYLMSCSCARGVTRKGQGERLQRYLCRLPDASFCIAAMSVLHLQTYVSDVPISLQAAISCCINTRILAAHGGHASCGALLGAQTRLEHKCRMCQYCTHGDYAVQISSCPS